MANIEMKVPQQGAPDKEKEGRYKAFYYQKSSETPYDGFKVDDDFMAYVTAGLSRFCPGALGFTDDKYFQIAGVADFYTFADFDMVMQILQSLSPEHLEMDMQEYANFRKYLVEIGKPFIDARMALEVEIRKEFDEMEAVIDRSATITGEA